MNRTMRTTVLGLAVALASAGGAASADAASQAAKGVTSCDGLFHVLHNDKISGVRLKKGFYSMAVGGKVTCFKAAALLHEFLELGKPIDGWQVNSMISTPTFMKGDEPMQTYFEVAFASRKRR